MADLVAQRRRGDASCPDSRRRHSHARRRHALIQAGAEKVSLNSAAVKNPICCAGCAQVRALRDGARLDANRVKETTGTRPGTCSSTAVASTPA
jgi:hypothetical protein